MEERSRDRVLSSAELSEVWQACEGLGEFGTIVRLLMLTGQRREEVAGMRWSELDLGKGLWSLPAERTKNRRPHDVPLSAEALALIMAVPGARAREAQRRGAAARPALWRGRRSVLRLVEREGEA